MPWWLGLLLFIVGGSAGMIMAALVMVAHDREDDDHGNV